MQNESPLPVPVWHGKEPVAAITGPTPKTSVIVVPLARAPAVIFLRGADAGAAQVGQVHVSDVPPW